MIPKKILIIDDEKDYSMLLMEHLEAISNFEVFTAPTGKDGLRLAKKIKPNLVILDIMMPGMDGFETLEKLKKDTATVAIPVIMLSAKTDDFSKTKAAQLYNELYLTKPIDARELKTKIDLIFKRRGEE